MVEYPKTVKLFLWEVSHSAINTCARSKDVYPTWPSLPTAASSVNLDMILLVTFSSTVTLQRGFGRRSSPRLDGPLPFLRTLSMPSHTLLLVISLPNRFVLSCGLHGRRQTSAFFMIREALLVVILNSLSSML